MILDPFDKSYNPAKSVKIGSHLESLYFAAFEKELSNLINEWKFSA